MGQYSAKVLTNEKVSDTVWKLTLNIHKEQNLSYEPGQFIIIELPKPPSQSSESQEKLPRGYYSIASAPSKNGDIELLVEHGAEGGEVSKWLVERKRNDKIKLEGPMGKMVLKQADKWPQAFLGFRAGLAPLRAMIQAALVTNSSQSLWLFLGTDSAENLLLDQEWQTLAKANPRFKYVPCANPAEKLLEEISERKGIDLYLAGFKRNLDPMKAVLIEAGFPKTEMFTESFG